MDPLFYDFMKEAGRVINSGQARSLMLYGNITDVFYCENDQSGEYIPLPDLLVQKWSVSGNIVVVYELNGPLRFPKQGDLQKLREAWGKLHQEDDNQHAIDLALARTKKRLTQLKEQPRYNFDTCLKKAETNPTYALEFLRQLCLCSRLKHEDKPLLWEDLIIIVEGCEFLIPEGEISRMSDIDRKRIAICRDWFSDPGFANGRDSVVLMTESTSLINEKVAKLPQMTGVEILPPDKNERAHLIEWFTENMAPNKKLDLWGTLDNFAQISAGLSSHALLQLLKQTIYTKSTLQAKDVIGKVEEYIQNQLGEDVVEFKKPEHSLKDVVGFSNLKSFLNTEFIPRLRDSGKGALPGAAIGGPIGSGKSFLFEAVAGELGVVVLVLKNIRSKWFGGTDIIFERLKRIIYAIDKSLIFVDEADTQFGGVDAGAHATERRLTGKIQAMMSDPTLRGKTSWLLITARIHLLSPDIRRPGRAGSLIIPILDAKDQDQDDFIEWMIKPVFNETEECKDIKEAVKELKPLMTQYYAAAYAEMRNELEAKSSLNDSNKFSLKDIKDIIEDYVPPAVEKTRQYQTLQALINCTRLSLLPKDVKDKDISKLRESWRKEILLLEAEGIR